MANKHVTLSLEMLLMKRSPQMFGWKFTVLRITYDLAIWDGAPKTGIDMFFLVQERLLSFEWYDGICSL